MADTPLFSLIIPTYNRASFIGKTLRSALQQDFQDFEIIVVDDGSTDDTECVVSKFTDKRIRYFKKENAERAAARNLGVKKALGTYITFLDSDDLLRSNHFSTARKYLVKNDKAVIFSLGYQMVLPNGEVLYPFQKLPDPVNEKLTEGNHLSCIGVFVKREVLLETPFNEDRDLSGSEDYELWLRLAARYPIFTIPSVTAEMVNHDARSVLQINPEKLERRRSLLKHYVWSDPIVEKAFGRVRDKINGYMDLYVALHLAMGSYRTRAAVKLWEAFVQHPWMFFTYRFWVVVKKILFF
jgi:glycosyltransferase involved in cell wall biosynthesis